MVPSKSNSPVTPVMPVSPFSISSEKSSMVQNTIGTSRNSADRLSTMNARDGASAHTTMSKCSDPSR